MALLSVVIVLLALAVALWLRPWRMLAGGQLLSPLLASLVILPWLWALPRLHGAPLQLPLSGACMVVLMLGWPLAIPVLCLVALGTALIAPLPGWLAAVDLAVWLGVVPATLQLAVGYGLRRWISHHLFVYILGRAFIGTAASVFAAGVLEQWSGHRLDNVDSSLSLVAHWLMAWGDGFATGMLTAIFVAFRPQWLATWSDQLYLKR